MQASQPWCLYWIVHSLELLDRPVPAELQGSCVCHCPTWRCCPLLLSAPPCCSVLLCNLPWVLMGAFIVAGRNHEGCQIPYEEPCVWAGYDQLQANYLSLTP